MGDWGAFLTGVLSGLAAGVILEFSKSVTNWSGLVRWLTAGLLGLAVGVAVSVFLTPAGLAPPTLRASPSPSPPSLAVKVLEPRPGDRAPAARAFMVRGSVANLPAGHHLWLAYRTAGVDRYYFSAQAADITTTGAWSVSAQLGQRSERGRQYDIYALVADAQSHQELIRLNKLWKDQRSWPGEDKLPDGSRLCDPVTVTLD